MQNPSATVEFEIHCTSQETHLCTREILKVVYSYVLGSSAFSSIFYAPPTAVVHVLCLVHGRITHSIYLADFSWNICTCRDCNIIY